MEQNFQLSTSTRYCPTCGVSLANRDPVGHAQLHFPDTPYPVNAHTLKARQQQAELLGKKIPEE